MTIISKMVQKLPIRTQVFLRKLYRFGLSRYCPLCKSHVRSFLPFGVITQRDNAKCPVYGCLERHRLAWLFFQNKTDLFDLKPKTLLHIAPETQLEYNFKQIPGLDYLSADLVNPNAMVKMNIAKIQYPNDSFDIIYCSHVLEHILDDRKAISEFCRVLKRGGWAVLQVPINADKTFEDPTITDPSERERVFGQGDHVRIYGPDYEQRLFASGFRVQRYSAVEIAGAENVVRFSIMKSENIFHCTK